MAAVDQRGRKWAGIAATGVLKVVFTVYLQ
jgi:hypothetical protein